MDWIKLPASYFDNPKFGALPEVVQARFFKLYILAGIRELDGVINHSPDEIAWLLHITPKEMQETFNHLEAVGLYKNNGKGPELPFYLDEQVSKEDLGKKREAARGRQAKFKERGNTVTGNDVTPLPATESRVQSQSQSPESEKSLLVQSVSPPGLMDGLVKMTKADLVSWAGIPQTYKSKPLGPAIVQDDKIYPMDILSELARCYARKSKGSQVRDPAFSAGLNLLKHQPTPAEYYDQEKWISHLPKALQIKIGLFIQSAEKESEPVEYSGYTNITTETDCSSPAAQNWHAALELLWADNPNLLRKNWLDGTQGICFENGVFTVRAKDQAACEMLTSRLGSTMENYLKGILDTDLTVRFATPADLSGGDTP